MATLVSEQTGKRFHPKNDWPKLRKECERIERELGLAGTAGTDKTARKEPTRAEKGKAARRGKPETPREHLWRIVAQCAAVAHDGDEFLTELRQQGLAPKTTHDSTGRIRGYSVALPGDVTAEGTPVRFSGAKLAADLTWPKLLARWESTPPTLPIPRTGDGRVSPPDRRTVLDHAAEVADNAAAAIREGAENPEGIAHATGEVLASLARGREGRYLGPLTVIGERYDRAARTPHRVLPSNIGPLGRDLRHVARRIAAAGALSGRGNERFATLAVLLAVAGLISEIAGWQQARGRVHQAAAARHAAGNLREAAQAGEAGRRSRPLPAQPSTSEGIRHERRVVRTDWQQPVEPRPRDQGR